MTFDDYIAAIRNNGDRLLDAASSDLSAPVAACPGWDVARLVGHVGQVQAWMSEVVREPSLERPTHGFADRPEPEETVAWGRRQLDELVDALGQASPGTPCWTWAASEVIDFYPRRMAHETVVHRHDVEQAVGGGTPIDSDMATDGVDELIEVGLQYSANPEKEFSYPEGSLHLHRTDGEGEWLLRADGGSLVVTREHAKGDVAVRGSGPDLLLYLWGRGGSNLEIFGDETLAQAWSRVAP